MLIEGTGVNAFGSDIRNGTGQHQGQHNIKIAMQFKDNHDRRYRNPDYSRKKGPHTG